MLLKCCTQYASKFKKLSSSHRMGKGQFSFHSQRKAMPQKCSNYCTIATHFICQQDYAQNTSSQASIGHELRTSRCTSWIWEKAEEPEIKLPSYAGLQKKQGNSKNYLLLLHDYAKDFDCVDHNKLWNILDEMEILNYITCLLRNVHAGQEATVRTHGKTGWFQIGKAIYQNCILSPCLFSLYAEYIM